MMAADDASATAPPSPPVLSAPLSAEQQRMVEQTRWLVPHIARDAARRLKQLALRIDVSALADEGLTLAARSYDPTLGVPFERYARYRATGTIFDAARREARDLQRIQCAVREAGTDVLTYEKPRGDAFHDGDADVQGHLDSYCATHLAAMFASQAGEMARAVGEERFVLAEDELHAREALDRALVGLDEREQTLVRLHYFQGQDMRQVAKALRVSYPSVHRYRNKVLERLGIRLRAAGVTQAPPGSL
ncbi:MAG: sigma-70 family RNA polymerase sigma factor [Polyangiaceae bacterium]